MRQIAVATLIALGAGTLWQDPAAAQAKRVELNIAGYLCGY